MLSGIPAMSLVSLMLEPTQTTGADILLRPRIVYGEIRRHDYTIGDTDYKAWPWTKAEVRAAARWWRQVTMDRERLDERHVWLRGGVAFGRISPWEQKDFAIVVIILSRPDTRRPKIVYRHGSIELDVAHLPADQARGLTHISIDTTAEQVTGAAKWWRSLVRWQYLVGTRKVPASDLADILRAGLTPEDAEAIAASGASVGDAARLLLGLVAPPM